MGDNYGKLNYYNKSFDAESEVNELKEDQEAKGKQIDYISSTVNKQKYGLIFSYVFNIFLLVGLFLYLYLAFPSIGSSCSRTIHNAPIGTILAWVPKPEKTSSKAVSIPEGWMPCDGSPITQGPWKGGRTPDLNSIGGFLRGGPEDLVLEMEDSQIEDHQHDYTASYIINVY